MPQHSPQNSAGVPGTPQKHRKRHQKAALRTFLENSTGFAPKFRWIHPKIPQDSVQNSARARRTSQKQRKTVPNTASRTILENSQDSGQNSVGFTAELHRSSPEHCQSIVKQSHTQLLGQFWRTPQHSLQNKSRIHAKTPQDSPQNSRTVCQPCKTILKA